jgi:predicted amidohydrolase
MVKKGLNFRNCRRFVQNAKIQGPELVLIPEMTLTSFTFLS